MDVLVASLVVSWIDEVEAEEDAEDATEALDPRKLSPGPGGRHFFFSTRTFSP